MWILYNTQTRHDIKYEILARHIFSQIKALIYELICVKIFFYPESIKNYNGAVAMRNYFVRRERKQKLHRFFKVLHRGIKYFLNCSPMFLHFLFQWNWRGFALHKMRPLKWQKMLFLLTSCHVFLRNMPHINKQ